MLRQVVLKLRLPLLVLGSAAGLTAFLFQIKFGLLESRFYDFRIRTAGVPSPNSNIVLVSMDDATVKAVQDVPPLPLDVHVRFLESLERLKPRALGYLIDLNRVAQVNPDLVRGPLGQRFVDAVRRLEAGGTKVILGTPFDVTGEVLPPYPLSQLSHSIAVIHRDGNVFANDDVTRRALVYLYDKPVFHLDLARQIGARGDRDLPRGSYFVPEIEGMYFLFRYHADTHAYLPGGGYPEMSYLQVLEGNLPEEGLKDKIVLVGTQVKTDPSDYASTPYGNEEFTHPKLHVHANILDAMISDTGIVRPPKWVTILLTFLFSAAVILAVFRTSPAAGLVVTFGIALLFKATSHGLFAFYGIWVRESHPLVGIVLAYYLAVPYRLILEYRKRWNLQRKTEILAQVEELKTNFLRLVTHDLKTPVARIQGLAEVLKRKAAGRLNERDHETVSSIITATDDLNRFISSILELTHVESNRLQLQFESKDVNLLIERSVEALSPLARARGVKIDVRTEPLFPIRIDPGLISKVLNNVIDNAIKYSPRGGHVIVESRESGPWVEISVTDSGIGMSADETEHLFTRFYRVRNQANAELQGTGLGLYLTKYFIEAHHGQVAVVSKPGQGSTFKILLPLESGVGATPTGLTSLGRQEDASSLSR